MGHKITAQRLIGKAHLRVKNHKGETCLSDLDQTVPLRVFFPPQKKGAPLLAVLVTISGGLVAGDHLTISAETQENCRLTLMTQAAEKIYRSEGKDCIIDITLKGQKNSYLEYLSQETILFDHSRLKRTTLLELDDQTTMMAGEITVFGRIVRGEEWRHGLFRDQWIVKKKGRLIWTETLLLEGDIHPYFDNQASLNQSKAIASLIIAVENPQDYLSLIREKLNDDAGATCVNGLLVIRWLSKDSLALRTNFSEIWCLMREIFHCEATMPRLWQI